MLCGHSIAGFFTSGSVGENSTVTGSFHRLNATFLTNRNSLTRWLEALLSRLLPELTRRLRRNHPGAGRSLDAVAQPNRKTSVSISEGATGDHPMRVLSIIRKAKSVVLALIARFHWQH